MLDSVVEFTDSRGYHYVAVSEAWKRLCLDLPCSGRVVVPPVYRTQWLDTVIDGHEVVLQAWKGDCPHLAHRLPGGIGGEVGIYRKIPGKSIPRDLAIPALEGFPAALRPEIKLIAETMIRDIVGWAEAGVPLWWPFPGLGVPIEMRLVNPRSGEVFFEADPPEPAGSYWMSRWMSYESYALYAARELLDVPLVTQNYIMEFSVGGRRFRWGDPDAPIECL